MDAKAIEARNADRRARSAAAAVMYDPSEKRTKESEAAECDVNLIMKRAQSAGLQWPVDASAIEREYLDCVGIEDFQASQAKVAAGLAIFDGMSAPARAAFENDPSKFFAYAADPANQDAVIDLLVGKERADAYRREVAARAAREEEARAVDLGKTPGGSAPGVPAAPAAGSVGAPGGGDRPANLGAGSAG